MEPTDFGPAPATLTVFATFGCEERLGQALRALGERPGWAQKYHLLALRPVATSPRAVLRSTLVSVIGGERCVRTAIDPDCQMTRALWGLKAPVAHTQRIMERMVADETVLVFSVSGDLEAWAQTLRECGATLVVSTGAEEPRQALRRPDHSHLRPAA